MKVFIITMDDPVYTGPFIRSIIEHRRESIVGLAVSKGDRLRIGKQKSKAAYLFSLLLIMGITRFIRYSFIEVSFKLHKKLAARLPFIKSPSILAFAESQGIPVWDINTPNGKAFLAELAQIAPDVIINQSQSILKEKLLSIPRIGTVNRHNALLPKNRGRLTPFWVLYKEEKETGVSIHFVSEGIDAGEIIVQERFPVEPRDNFHSIVRKNYERADKAMLKALDILEKGDYQLIPNNEEEATYNTIPEPGQAWEYRKKQIRKMFRAS